MIASHRNLKPALAVVFFCFSLGLSSLAFAKESPDYVHTGRNIVVGPNEQVGDVTCLACSIRIRGQVSGDATAIFGSITVEDQGQVGGEMTAIAGDIRLAGGTSAGGDVTAVGGDVRRDATATIGGELTAITGRAWVILILAIPFAVLGALISLVVWLVRRIRRPAIAVPA